MQTGNERTKPSEVSFYLIKLELRSEGAPGGRWWTGSGSTSLFLLRCHGFRRSPKSGGQWPTRKKGVSKGTRVEHRLTQGQSIIRRRLKGHVGKCLDRARLQARDNEWLRMGPRDVLELIQLSGKKQDDVSWRSELIDEIWERF